jgi:hypothetical protein
MASPSLPLDIGALVTYTATADRPYTSGMASRTADPWPCEIPWAQTYGSQGLVSSQRTARLKRGQPSLTHDADRHAGTNKQPVSGGQTAAGEAERMATTRSPYGAAQR